ncbi:TIGR02281 family clan AA aspartic protease [Novosphingobium sp. JCM 18896]|uniref:retropepsin-like aspartic protease family protein n=1 Tax=Novosphingobium sp. JCM 18896 TaxID=2989731 RepID=UPI00222387BC|nr:TIGR02281 family clan AA aspartic protease [Novosphingobium sp. JCM 18896]MCW1427905.1 TIGR02281 family clan AA aspartic protease [Novosphingobium sp. JCM 18896]
MNLQETFDFLREQPLLALAVAAIFAVTLGGMIKRATPRLGGLIQGLGNLSLVAALLLTIVQVARLTTGNDLALPQIGLPEQRVTGGETRIAMSNDGHFWLQAQVNGRPYRFLVDTGATLTALSESTATEAQVPIQPLRQSVMMKTANGTIRAELARIDEMRFGNVVARDLDAVIAPGLGETNVLGMNLLSRLASWRVEGRTLVLVPNHPQVEADAS